MHPFTVTLQSFDLFRNKKNATLWLSPETSPDRMALDKLQLTLQAYDKKKYMQKKIGFADICVSYFFLYVCPHTEVQMRCRTICVCSYSYVSSYHYMCLLLLCVLIPLYVSALLRTLNPPTL